MLILCVAFMIESYLEDGRQDTPTSLWKINPQVQYLGWEKRLTLFVKSILPFQNSL